MEDEPMNFSTAIAVAIIGIIATGYMTLAHAAFTRFNNQKSNIFRAIGSFVVPEWSPAAHIGLIAHFAGGVFFAGVYIFLLNLILEDRSIASFMLSASMIGLVQGFFLSFFMMMVAALSSGIENEHVLFLKAGLENIILHIIYGAFIGLGLGMFVKQESALSFGLFAGLVLCVLTAALFWTTTRTTPRDRPFNQTGPTGPSGRSIGRKDGDLVPVHRW